MIEADVAVGAGDNPAPQFRVVALDRVDSTNEEAKRRACAGAEAGTVVWARRQEAGRGRHGRHWESPEGNFYGSLILRPRCLPAVGAQVSLVAAVAVGEAVAACLGGVAEPQLKWPNDVLIRGRKVAGILLESDLDATAGRLLWLVVGVGINVLQFPNAVDYPATALAAEGALKCDAAGVLEMVLASFQSWYRRWSHEGLSPILDAWLARAVGLGAPVTVRLHDGSFTGIFAGLDRDGALLLEPATGGPVRRVAAGEVFFPWMTEPMRPAHPFSSL